MCMRPPAASPMSALPCLAFVIANGRTHARSGYLDLLSRHGAPSSLLRYRRKRDARSTQHPVAAPVYVHTAYEPNLGNNGMARVQWWCPRNSSSVGGITVWHNVMCQPPRSTHQRSRSGSGCVHAGPTRREEEWRHAQARGRPHCGTGVGVVFSGRLRIRAAPRGHGGLRGRAMRPGGAYATLHDCSSSPRQTSRCARPWRRLLSHAGDKCGNEADVEWRDRTGNMRVFDVSCSLHCNIVLATSSGTVCV